MFARIWTSTALAAILLLPGVAGCAGTPAGPVADDRSPAAKARPDHPLLVRAEQAYLAGDRDAALLDYRSYRTGFDGGPFTSDAWYWEGVILLEKGDAAGARTAFSAATAGARSRFIEAQARIGLGDCAFVCDRFGDAIDAYQSAIALHCPDARNDYCLYRLAAARQRNGEWSAGRSDYELLLRDHPKSQLTARVEQRLRYPDQAYHLQVGAFGDEESAGVLRGLVQSKGVNAKVVRTGGPEPYLVWVGTYMRYDEAREARGDVQQMCGREAVLVP
jgi:tetratricopeptide (TPR) repeat protein